ncbi:NAD(P)/FAD-dependent oxidoreductase [Leptolyngbya sp. 15MV]|nr:NAD(P)/FAD-dependent oxidoreductase [Leptolyngbya sp. 15MV]
MLATAPDFDVLIVGAGISGIGMAAHMEMMCPTRSYAVVERRENLGGTWDLFRYPGIRSDSDMHTLGFVFEPWKHEKSIADAPAILDYLHRIVDERGIRQHIRFGKKVVSADWRGDEARWHVTLEAADGAQSHVTANFLYLGSGYYDYDEPYDPAFALGEFGGQVIHPQFWPEDLDYAGKKVVVIGSGATAVTIVPAMADKAGHVTMLQRTPTWMFSRPAKDGLANFLRRILPERLAYKITRWKNIKLQDYSFKLARNKPQKVKDGLHKRIRKSMGADYDLTPFTPPYNPWEQRLCLVPDDDLFEAIKRGRASVVTGRISRFVQGGVELDNGEMLEADIIVTATGLRLAVGGKIAVSQDGVPVNFAERFYYKGCMFSNLPNLAVVFGYLNASWTLRADINSEFVCRVLNEMERRGSDVAVPVLPADHGLEEDDLFDFSSGYIQRGKHIMPKSATTYPWRLNQEYVFDRKVLREGAVDDGVLAFRKAEAGAPAEQQLEAAE